MARMIRVTREYQLGAVGGFTVRGKAGMLLMMAADRRSQERGSDLQGITYAVATCHDALAIGATDTGYGWYIGDTPIRVASHA